MATEKERGSVSDRVRRRIRELREAQGMTQEALGEAAGVSVDAITRIESGKRTPTLETLAKIAGALGVSAKDLVGSEGRKPSFPAVALRLAGLLGKEPKVVQDAAEEIVRVFLRATPRHAKVGRAV